MATCCMGCCKKNLITKNDIRYPENGTVFEDFHFMCRCILCSHKVIKISEPLYNYRRTNVSSITNTLTVSRKNMMSYGFMKIFFVYLNQ